MMVELGEALVATVSMALMAWEMSARPLGRDGEPTAMTTMLELARALTASVVKLIWRLSRS